MDFSHRLKNAYKNTDAALISSVNYLIKSNEKDKNILSSTEYENTKLLLNSVFNILNETPVK